LRIKSLSQEAYDRLEALIVTTDLQPGARTTLNELERLSGFGRTPVHDAVKRLSAESLIIVQPRSGLRIAPLDLEQERLLLPVRIEMEAIACRLAAERASGDDLIRLSTAAEKLRCGCGAMSLAEFNIVDNELNDAILMASGELMLGNTLMPLQTLYRRSGWLYQTKIARPAILTKVAADHLELLDLILKKDAAAAERWVRTMLAGVYFSLQELQKIHIGSRNFRDLSTTQV
jgi:DNA-binding GntR family transcriptional regulator